MRFGKIFVLILSVLACVICLGACSDGEETPKEDVYYNVTFDSAGGSAVEGARVLSGSKIAVPDEPVKEGFIFNGWRKKGAIEWDFESDKVTSDITLTAGWIDAKTVFDYTLDNGTATITDYKGKLEVVRVPTHIAGYPITAVGDNAFKETLSTSTREITVGDNIVSIGNSAFFGCSGIKITLECKPTSIGERAFYKCTSLEAVTLGAGLKNVPAEAFLGCEGLVSVVLSDTVESISENAFDGCTALKTLTAHSSLRTVADSAFVGCDALKAVYYYGTAEQWASTQISEGNNGNDALIGAEFYMYSATEPAADAEGKYWYFKENGNIRIW